MLAPAHYWLVPEAEALADRLAELRRQRKQRRQAKKPAPKPWVPVAHANSAKQQRQRVRRRRVPNDAPRTTNTPAKFERALAKALAAMPPAPYAAYAPKVPDWSTLPLEVDVACELGGGALPEARRPRKREQLANMLSLLGDLVRPGDVVADFCSGLGHQTLPLAFLRRDVSFVLVDRNPFGLGVAARRCETLGMANVRTFHGTVRDFKDRFDVGVALHACGAATDDVLDACVRVRAAFVVAPCCVGGVAAAKVWRDVVPGAGDRPYPRSCLLRDAISTAEYAALARSADTNADGRDLDDKAPRDMGRRRLCKTIVETDRLRRATEGGGYDGRLVLMEPLACTPKNDIIVGWRDDDERRGAFLAAAEPREKPPWVP